MIDNKNKHGLQDFIATWYPRYCVTNKPYRRQIDNTLTEAYFDLKALTAFSKSCEDDTHIRPQIVRVKRRIRARIKPITISDCVCIHSDFDSAVYKYDLGPIETRTKRQVKHFCSENWRNAPCTPYDCTGKIFTTGMHYGVLHGHWIVWEYVSLDV